MLIAWLKLRQRNLGPILDANGWAVNARTKVNIPLGALSPTWRSCPGLRALARRSLRAEEEPVWPKVLLVLVVLGLAAWGLHRTPPPEGVGLGEGQDRAQHGSCDTDPRTHIGALRRASE